MSQGIAGGQGVKLVLAPRGATQAAKLEVGTEAVRIGRDPGCDLVVQEATVSRRHVRLFWDGNELAVEDLNSSGGTFLNGLKIQRAVIRPGDVLRLGPRTEFVLEEEAPSTTLGLAMQKEGEEQGGVRHLQVLLDVARALNAATVLEEVLEIVLQAAVRLTKADRGYVVLVEGTGKRSALAVYPRGLAESAWGERSTLLERVIKERRTLQTGGAVDLSTSMVGRGVGMAVAAPLLVARRPIGSATEASFIATVEAIGGILVERSAMGAAFSREELGVFESLASDAAVAVDSARLYREARDKAKIEHEMELARTIQAALLKDPPLVPFAEISAFSQPARSVGGDLYHSMLRQDGTLGVALGDVSGKGVAAALIMAMMQGLLEMLNDIGRPLGDFPLQINRTLQQYNPGNRFLTLAAGLLTPSGQFTLVNAGHCPVAVVRAAGGVELVKSHGPVLGLLPLARWGTTTVNLERGDVVVFYSDGIAESFSPTGEEFGTEGVERTVGALAGKDAKTITRALLDAAAEYRVGREAEDDVTILSMRYTGSGE
jgi:serine phosphatase RsbU (regulator of sigma subunit)/pSer/pThr/pTyr-binding forkhead associated (FHA) protein